MDSGTIKHDDKKAGNLGTDLVSSISTFAKTSFHNLREGFWGLLGQSSKEETSFAPSEENPKKEVLQKFLTALETQQETVEFSKEAEPEVMKVIELIKGVAEPIVEPTVEIKSELKPESPEILEQTEQKKSKKPTLKRENESVLSVHYLKTSEVASEVQFELNNDNDTFEVATQKLEGLAKKLEDIVEVNSQAIASIKIREVKTEKATESQLESESVELKTAEENLPDLNIPIVESNNANETQAKAKPVEFKKPAPTKSEIPSKDINPNSLSYTLAYLREQEQAKVKEASSTRSSPRFAYATPTKSNFTRK